VEAGENLGFLPGDLHEKVDPYLRPLYDALEDMMPRDRVQKAIDNRSIEIAPLAYMRGRTLSDAFVILDEAQNATGMQMKMFLTRLGVDSRAVITGDKTQIDLANREDSGLLQVERILPGIEGIGFCYLGDGDVVRHRLVRAVDSAQTAMHAFCSSIERAADSGGAAVILQAAKAQGFALSPAEASYLAKGGKRHALEKAMSELFDRTLAAGVTGPGVLQVE